MTNRKKPVTEAEKLLAAIEKERETLFALRMIHDGAERLDRVGISDSSRQQRTSELASEYKDLLRDSENRLRDLEKERDELNLLSRRDVSGAYDSLIEHMFSIVSTAYRVGENLDGVLIGCRDMRIINEEIGTNGRSHEWLRLDNATNSNPWHEKFYQFAGHPVYVDSMKLSTVRPLVRTASTIINNYKGS